jgi:hypothetical protein
MATDRFTANDPMIGTGATGADGRKAYIQAVSLATEAGSALPGDANGTVVQPALSSTFWNYAPPAGGIVNTTTAVTIKTAAGAGVRNYIKSLQLTADTLGAATEFAIRDGAAGTVLARIKINTAGLTASGTTIFDPPLRGSANTLVEIVTLSATISGGVFANLQGYTGV